VRRLLCPGALALPAGALPGGGALLPALALAVLLLLAAFAAW
jgi:hypothetical protein